MRSLPRGTKLQVEMVYDPLQEQQQRIEDRNCAPSRTRSNTFMSWTFDCMTASFFEQPSARVILPFILPPLQQQFNVNTQNQVQYGIELTSLCLSFDQRATATGITGYDSASDPGLLTDADMSRYTIFLRLVQRIPTFYGGTQDNRLPIYQIEIPGTEVFGNPLFFRNPLLIQDLTLQLQNNRSYYWELSIPGLYTATPLTEEQLALPSFTLQAGLQLPLLEETQSVQNLPVGTWAPLTLPVNVPAVDSIIGGSADLQAPMLVFDTFLMERLQAGRGAGSGGQQMQGQEQELSALQSYLRDRGYTCIVVPMWQGYQDCRCSSVTADALPGTIAPWTDSTMDRRVVRVPDGFVLHHALAIQNLNSPDSTNTRGFTGRGTTPTSLSFSNAIGIAMHNGLRTEDFKYQQVAYCNWTEATVSNILVDDIQFPAALASTACRILSIPLVGPAPGDGASYYATGIPFFMGSSNDVTQTRTQVGQMPPQFGGGAVAAPGTDGAENMLEVRWVMDDVIAGLDNPLDPDGVLIGVGGHQVLLIGSVPVQ